MRFRRFVGLLALSVAATVAAPAQAAPQQTPFFPMALVTISSGPALSTPLDNTIVTAPSGWGCETFRFDNVIDVTCIPPAAPPGTVNWCGWVAASSYSDEGQQFAPQTTSYCGNAAATAGRSTAAAVATANTQLNALRCRVVLSVNPPSIAFRAACTTNH